MSSAVVLKAFFTKRFGHTRSPHFVLEVDFQAAPGVTVLFGPSGAGKTTTLRCLAGLLRPDSGRIVLGDRVLFDAEANVDLPPRQRSVGCVFQRPALFPHLTVEENVGYSLRSLSRPARERVVRELLELFGIAGLAQRLPSAISGGEYQRAALARALAPGPALLLLDEPLAALDWPTRRRILAELRQWLHRHAVPVLYVTHDPQEATTLGEHVLVIEQGRLREYGASKSLLPITHRALSGEHAPENQFDAEPVALQPDSQSMLCRLLPEGETIEVPLFATVAGRFRLGVAASDLLLASEQPRGLAVSNILRGQIVEVRSESLVIVRSAAGLLWQVAVPGAPDGSTFFVGQPVWVIVPRHRCRVLHV